MALNLGTISAEIRLQTQQFTAALTNVTNLMRNAFGSQTQSNVNGTANSVNNLTSHLKNVERVIGGIVLSQTFYRMNNDIQKAAGSLMTFMNNMEKSKVAMQYFLGDRQKANGFLMSMQDFAANTPFSTEQAVSLSQRLMAAQFSPEKVKSVMTILNDAASVGGTTAEQLDRIVLAITQMRTNGKIAGQELRQLAEANIPIYKILQQQLGLTSDQLMNIGKLHISGDVGVGALLKGLEERYKGAADRIAMTIPGMMETIKDDLKMVGADLFVVPYKSFENFLRGIRNGLEWMRETVFRYGIGGLFERMFTPQTMMNLRYLMGAFRSLIQSASYLVSALKPVVDIIGGWLTRVMADAALPIAGLIRTIAILAIIAINTLAPVKYLLAAIIALSVGYTVAKILMILWRVTGLGLICTTVARSVTTLVTAMRMLAAVTIANPWIIAILLLGGALVYFGAKLKAVHTLITGLKNAFAGMAGFDVADVFTPSVNQAAASMDGFNQSVIDANSNLDQTGAGLDKTADKAKKAAKKIKDSFLQSFDEIHNINPKADESANDLADAGADAMNGINIPDLGGLPEVPDLAKVMGPESFKLPTGKDLFPKASDLWKDIKKAFSDGWDDLKKWWNDINWFELFFNIGKGISDGLDAIGGWFSGIGRAFSNWDKKITKQIDNWADRQVKRFDKWGRDIWDTSTKWLSNVWGSITGWVSNTWNSFTGWVSGTTSTIANWITDTATSFGNWASGTWSTFTNWVTNTAGDIANWSAQTAGSIANWATNAWNNISSWASNTWNSFTNWVANTASSIGNWAANTGSAIWSWVSNTAGNIGNWAANVGRTIANWASNAWSTLAGWAGNAASSIWGGFAWLGNSIGSVFSGIWSNGIKPGLNIAIRGINSFIDFVNGLHVHVPGIHIPGIVDSKGFDLNFTYLPHIPQLETGGIVKKDQLIRAGERNHREAVVPLENPSYMKPFSDAVASQLMKSGAFGGGGNNQQQPVLYVGTLIADDKSLKELNRRMRVISLKENNRGVAPI